MKRSGTGLVGILVLSGLLVALVLPLATLSSRNVEDFQEMLERSTAQGLCLDMLERFNRYKPFWPMPGAAELYTPVGLSPDQLDLFDRAYLDQLTALGMHPRPKIERTPVDDRPGLYRLQVSIAWTSLGGQAREVSYARYCYWP
ncbi:MAG: hypothetical protein HY815_05660 [Candidatus Riflebacteria bacterium]|nr:hypothetical protein [Candidatus Riflebacteria bacterium]